MNEGLLWFDNQKNVDLNVRVGAAVKHFEAKFGYAPEKCFVNPSTLESRSEIDEKIEIIADDKVLANHFWLEFISK